MRIDTFKIPFAGVAEDGNIAVLHVESFERFAVGVEVTSVTGAPTNFHFEAHPAESATDGTEFKTAGDLRSPDMTAAGRTMLTMRGSPTPAPVNPVQDNAFVWIHIHAHFTGGAAPTVAGNVFVWRTEK